MLDRIEDTFFNFQQKIMRSDTNKLASLAVVFSSVLFSYGKVWTQRIAHKPPYPELSNFINAVLIGLVLVCVVLKIIISFKTYTRLKWQSILVFCALLLTAFLYYKTHSIGIDFLLAGFIGLALYREKPSFLIKTTFFLYLCFFIFQLCGYELGIFHDSAIWLRPEQAAKIRLDLGFGYPTYVFTYFLPVILGLYYLHHVKYKKILTVLCISLLSFIYVTTNTRAVIFMSVLMLFNPIIEKGLKRWKCVRIATISAYPIFTLLSFIAILGAEHFQTIGRLLSGRLWFWGLYLNGGVSLWGPTTSNKILYHDSQFPLDNQLLLHLFIGGIITYLIIGIMYMKLTKTALECGDYRLAIIVVNTLEFGLSEANFSLGVIIFMPLLFSVFLQRKTLL